MGGHTDTWLLLIVIIDVIVLTVLAITGTQALKAFPVEEAAAGEHAGCIVGGVGALKTLGAPQLKAHAAAMFAVLVARCSGLTMDSAVLGFASCRLGGTVLGFDHGFCCGRVRIMSSWWHGARV
jgi:hypothetical protein